VLSERRTRTALGHRQHRPHTIDPGTAACGA
jgi:hypothetical protein